MKKLLSFSFCSLLLIVSACGTGNKPAHQDTSQQQQQEDSANPADEDQQQDAQSGDQPATDATSEQQPATDGQSEIPSQDPTDQEITDQDNTDQETTDTEALPTTATEWATALIAGKVNANTAFTAIAQGSGFPVITDKPSIIFLHLCDSDDWYVAGDFNNWQQTKMTKSGDICYLEIEGSATATFYKFVQNNNYIADPYAQNYTYDENGEISYIIAPTDKPYLKKWPLYPQAKGLLPRTLRAYVPGNYRSYDVVYAQDGQNLFGGGWKIEENMQKIDGRFLVVGIDNSTERMNEYTHVSDTAFGTYYATKGRLYAAFVNEEVRPFIEQRFTTTDKRGLMGSSLGGLISLYIAHLYPEDYRMVLALSPSTAWGRFSNDTGTTIEDLYKKAGHRQFALYLDNGGSVPEDCGNYDTTTANNDESNGANSYDNYCFTRHFVDTMADEVGYTWDKDLHHRYVSGAQHNEAAWAARVNVPLEIFKNLE